MSLCQKLRTYLDQNHIQYVTIEHSPAYTAQGVAASAHISGRTLVKPVMVRADGKHFMVATAANQRVDLEKFEAVVGATDAYLEREEDFRSLFEDCEPGAMPPFGNLYGIPVVADEAIFDDEEIAFNGGDHSTVVKMAFKDFERLVQPKKACVARGH